MKIWAEIPLESRLFTLRTEKLKNPEKINQVLFCRKNFMKGSRRTERFLGCENQNNFSEKNQTKSFFKNRFSGIASAAQGSFSNAKSKIQKLSNIRSCSSQRMKNRIEISLQRVHFVIINNRSGSGSRFEPIDVTG